MQQVCQKKYEDFMWLVMLNDTISAYKTDYSTKLSYLNENSPHLNMEGIFFT